MERGKTTWISEHKDRIALMSRRVWYMSRKNILLTKWIALLHENPCHIVTDLEFFKTHLKQTYLFIYLLGWGKACKIRGQLPTFRNWFSPCITWSQILDWDDQGKASAFTHCVILIAFQTYSWSVSQPSSPGRGQVAVPYKALSLLKVS